MIIIYNSLESIYWIPNIKLDNTADAAISLPMPLLSTFHMSTQAAWHQHTRKCISLCRHPLTSGTCTAEDQHSPECQGINSSTYIPAICNSLVIELGGRIPCFLCSLDKITLKYTFYNIYQMFPNSQGVNWLNNNPLLVSFSSVSQFPYS